MSWTRPVRRIHSLGDSDRSVIAPVRVVGSRRRTKNGDQVIGLIDCLEVENAVALLDIVYRADVLFADELDRLASSRASVSDASVTGLLRLAEDLRPGAAAHAQLAAFDPEVQVAGATEWIARRRIIAPYGELLPPPRLAAGDERPEQPRVAHRSVSAVSRARTRWHGQASR